MGDDLGLEQFRDIFVQEAKEHLAALNKNVLELEKNPSDNNILDRMFRSVHTIKGMGATMGFEQITQLTHSMENVLAKLRTSKADKSIVSLLFECLDSLERLVEEIASNQNKAVNIEAHRRVNQRQLRQSPRRKKQNLRRFRRNYIPLKR
jgi:two-component system chemotaxis sensor kinase CheA